MHAVLAKLRYRPVAYEAPIFDVIPRYSRKVLVADEWTDPVPKALCRDVLELHYGAY